jgi:hypothetical protein
MTASAPVSLNNGVEMPALGLGSHAVRGSHADFGLNKPDLNGM